MEIILSVIAFAVVSTITPGPNNVMIMASGLNHGIKRTLPHYFGICLGFPAMFLALGIGLGAAFNAYPIIHKVIKVVGISYLLYLAWKIATTEAQTNGEENDGNGGGKGRPFTFIQAALFQWVNPKAWVMGVGAFATYTTLDGNLTAEVLLITLTFFLAAFPCVGLWLGFGVVLQEILKKRAQRRIFNWTMALLLAASIVPMMPSILQ